jgi:hypothetical protein
MICTDGLSNVGVGSLEGSKEKGAEFYTRVGALAKKNETIINVLSIEGSDCAMDCLSRCAEMTSGTVNIVNPLELVRQIRAISQNPVIATNVKTSLFSHRCVLGLHVRAYLQLANTFASPNFAQTPGMACATESCESSQAGEGQEGA